MIEHGDFARPARVQVQDGEERDWRRPWRKRPKWRMIFIGFVETMQRDSRSGTSIVLVDSLHRLERNHWNVFSGTEPFETYLDPAALEEAK